MFNRSVPSARSRSLQTPAAALVALLLRQLQLCASLNWGSVASDIFSNSSSDGKLFKILFRCGCSMVVCGTMYEYVATILDLRNIWFSSFTKCQDVRRVKWHKIIYFLFAHNFRNSVDFRVCLAARMLFDLLSVLRLNCCALSTRIINWIVNVCLCIIRFAFSHLLIEFRYERSGNT